MPHAAPPLLSSRFFWRLYAGYVVLILVVTVVVGLLIEQRVRRDQLRNLQDNLHAEAFLLREAALPFLRGDASQVDGDLQARIELLATDDPTRLTVVRADGTVLADSRQQPAAMDDHGNRTEILRAGEEGVGTSSRFSRTVGADLLYVAVRVPAEGELLGYVRTAYPLSAVEESVARLRSVVLLGAGAAALVGLLIGYVFARRVTAPLAEMTAAVEELSHGGYGHVDVYDPRDELGRLALAFNSMSDDLRKRMEINDADRAKVLAILSSMVEGVVAVDGRERVVHMNAVAGRMMGVRPGDAVGKRIWEVTRIAEIPQTLERTADREQVSAQVDILSAGPEPILIELTASPLRDASGDRAGAVVVLHDVTALRRLEQVRRDFVANVSHELKTPLTAIRGMVETMLDDPDMEIETGRRFLRRIADQAVRLSTLVTDLLTLARIESTQAGPEPRALDLADPLRECVTRIQPLCQQKDVRLAVELPQEPMPLHADEEDLRQIFGNLLDNAVKYTPAGGHVTLRAEPEGGEARVRITDTGLGIEPRDQERIFERFYRVDKARSRELGGTGLGLAIVKHLVLTAGGRVAVESTPGRGSCFSVHLPLNEPS